MWDLEMTAMDVTTLADRLRHTTVLALLEDRHAQDSVATQSSMLQKEKTAMTQMRIMETDAISRLVTWK